MSDNSKISWTSATWNPVTGCDSVSPGCDHCYARTLAERFRDTPGHYFERGFDVVLRPDKLGEPFRWRKPRRIFVNSMSDLFHSGVPDGFIVRIFAVMALSPQHTFQVLTKRHARMCSLLNSETFRQGVAKAAVAMAEATPGPPYLPEHLVVTYGKSWWPLPNVWMGVSVEDQHWAGLRVPALLETPAAVRWLSCEPLLGEVDLEAFLWLVGSSSAGPFYDCLGRYRGGGGVGGQMITSVPSRDIGWIVAGGESGPGARLMQADWARLLRDQAAEAGVPFFFKQTGSVLARRLGIKSKGEGFDALPAEFQVREYPPVADVSTPAASTRGGTR
jgi:protein gp37